MAEDKVVKSENRRGMIRNSLRYAVVGVLGIGAIVVVRKRRRLIKEGRCENRGICGGCRIYAKCRLPQALSRKQVLAE